MNRKYDAVIFDLFGTLIDDLTYPESQMNVYRRLTFEMGSALGRACRRLPPRVDGER
jgi:hypothetical protein